MRYPARSLRRPASRRGHSADGRPAGRAVFGARSGGVGRSGCWKDAPRADSRRTRSVRRIVAAFPSPAPGYCQEGDDQPMARDHGSDPRVNRNRASACTHTGPTPGSIRHQFGADALVAGIAPPQWNQTGRWDLFGAQQGLWYTATLRSSRVVTVGRDCGVALEDASRKRGTGCAREPIVATGGSWPR